MDDYMLFQAMLLMASGLTEDEAIEEITEALENHENDEETDF